MPCSWNSSNVYISSSRSLLTGVGLIALGIAILAVFPLCKLVVKVLSSVFKGIATGVKNLFNKGGYCIMKMKAIRIWASLTMIL